MLNHFTNLIGFVNFGADNSDNTPAIEAPLETDEMDDDYIPTDEELKELGFTENWTEMTNDLIVALGNRVSDYELIIDQIETDKGPLCISVGDATHCLGRLDLKTVIDAIDIKNNPNVKEFCKVAAQLYKGTPELFRVLIGNITITKDEAFEKRVTQSMIGYHVDGYNIVVDGGEVKEKMHTLPVGKFRVAKNDSRIQLIAEDD